MHPTARRDDTLIAHALGDETMVYDAQRNEYHLLNPVAAAVWHRADGATVEGDMVEGVRRARGGSVDADEVRAALAALEAAGLLAGGPTGGDRAVSRRGALRQLGVATGLSFVTTILAPSAAMAASGAPPAPAPGVGNPGNDKPVGKAGETPGPGSWGGGSNGRSDAEDKKAKPPKDEKAPKDKQK